MADRVSVASGIRPNGLLRSLATGYPYWRYCARIACPGTGVTRVGLT